MSSELRIIRKLLDEFHNDNINYCHWKSNEHLEEAMTGKTDIDILIDRKSYAKVIEGLVKNNFKRFEIPFLRSYIAVEDYLGYDSDSGKIIHLHLHWQLTYGKKHIKENRLPWEEIALETRTWDKTFNTYTINVNLEALIFAIRMSVKVRTRDFFLKRGEYLSHGSKYEYNWLKNKIDKKKFESYVIELLGGNLLEVFDNFYEKSPKIKDLLNIRKSIKNFMKVNAFYGNLEIMVLRWIREGFRVLEFINKKTFKINYFYRRKFSTGGLVIGFLGSDGSGKSTILKKINKRLEKHMNVENIYLGSGDGESSIIRGPLLFIYKQLQKFKILNPKARSLSVNEDGKVTYNEKKFSSLIRNIGKIPWALTLSSERSKKLKRMIRYRNKGFLIFTDRFPQNQIIGSQDGPKLKNMIGSSNKLISSIGKIENKPYILAEQNTPDIIIRLQVSPEVAMKRKPSEVSINKSKDSTKLVNSIKFKKCKIIDLNADEDLEFNLKKIMNIIWSNL